METARGNVSGYPRIKVRREHDSLGSYNVLSVSMGPDLTETSYGFSDFYDSEGGGKTKPLTVDDIRKKNLKKLAEDYYIPTSRFSEERTSLSEMLDNKFEENIKKITVKDLNKYGARLVDKYHQYAPYTLEKLINSVVPESAKEEDISRIVKNLNQNFKTEVFKKWEWEERVKAGIVDKIIDEQTEAQKSERDPPKTPRSSLVSTKNLSSRSVSKEKRSSTALSPRTTERKLSSKPITTQTFTKVKQSIPRRTSETELSTHKSQQRDDGTPSSPRRPSKTFTQSTKTSSQRQSETKLSTKSQQPDEVAPSSSRQSEKAQSAQRSPSTQLSLKERRGLFYEKNKTTSTSVLSKFNDSVYNTITDMTVRDVGGLNGERILKQFPRVGLLGIMYVIAREIDTQVKKKGELSEHFLDINIGEKLWNQIKNQIKIKQINIEHLTEWEKLEGKDFPE